MKRIKLLILLLIAVSCINAQNEPAAEAGVYTVWGKAKIKRNGKAVQLKRKDIVRYSDTVLIENSSSLTLLTRGLKYVELRQPGQYTLSSLVNDPHPSAHGITQKYFELIWHEFFKPEQSKSTISPTTIGGAMGGASRGECSLLTLPLQNMKTSSDTLTISWKPYSQAKLYKLTMEDKSGNELFSIITPGTQLVVLKRGLLKNETDEFIVSVTPDNDRNNQCAGTRISFSWYTQAAAEQRIKELVRETVPGNNEFQDMIRISDRLGLDGWYTEACRYYLKALTLLKK